MEILEKIIVDKIAPANKNVLWCDVSGDKPYLRKNISGQWKSLYVSTLYQVNVTSGDGGTATSSKSKFKVGDSITLAATNSQGYAFSKWQSSADGVSYTDISGATNAEYTVTLIEEKDYYFKAVFVQVFSVNVTSEGNGSVSASASTVIAGGSVILTATADSGYTFYKWSDSDSSNPRTITNIQNNISLSATFAASGYTVTVVPTRVLNPSDVSNPDFETESALINYKNVEYNEVLVSSGENVSFDRTDSAGTYVQNFSTNDILKGSMYGGENYVQGSYIYYPDKSMWLGIEYSTNNGTTWTRWNGNSISVHNNILVRGIQTGFVYDLPVTINIESDAEAGPYININYTIDGVSLQNIEISSSYYSSSFTGESYWHLPVFDGISLNFTGTSYNVSEDNPEAASFNFNYRDTNDNTDYIDFYETFNETYYFGEHSNYPQGIVPINYQLKDDNYLMINFYNLPE